LRINPREKESPRRSGGRLKTQRATASSSEGKVRREIPRTRKRGKRSAEGIVKNDRIAGEKKRACIRPQEKKAGKKPWKKKSSVSEDTKKVTKKN